MNHMPRRNEWLLSASPGSSVRVKKFSTLTLRESYQAPTPHSVHLAMDLLRHNERVARLIYADLHGATPHPESHGHLSARAWHDLRHAFRHGRYVLTPVHPTHRHRGPGRQHPAPAPAVAAAPAPAPAAAPAAGAPRDWTQVPTNDRLSYVMRLLVDTYHYPVNGAAGIVGNLYAESGVLPNRLEGSAPGTPMRSRDFAGRRQDFTAAQIMNRSSGHQTGPRLPGIGLAQWTYPSRRRGLFHRTDNAGNALGENVLNNMDAQVEYLVRELTAQRTLNATLNAGGVTVDGACDDVVYIFERPGSILDPNGHVLPRTHAAVQAVFAARRRLAQQALQAHQAAQAAQAQH
jgi:Phage tail lysozyme